MLHAKRLPVCLLAALAISAGTAWSATALAQDAPPPPGAHDDRDGPPPGAYRDREDGPDVADGPPVGYDAAYDYGVANDPDSDADPYYQYQGPPPTDPRAREQVGLRYGTLPIRPRTSYYAGVRLYGDYGYGYEDYRYGGYAGCGCAYYRRRYSVYYDDFGQRGASYRGYDDHRHDDYGRGYGD
jgi:hypothetical protein